MKSLQTDRLVLREFCESDYEAVHSYGSNIDNIRLMIFGPNTEQDTSDYIKRCLDEYASETQTNYQFAITLRQTGQLIGGCGLTVDSELNQAEVGWVLHMNHWKKGYGTELAHALLQFGFKDLGLRRIIAHCDCENYGSYRVMERNGMRRENHNILGRNLRGEWRDEYMYAILNVEWETLKHIKHYNKMPAHFDNFIQVPELTDGTIYLVCTAKKPGIPEKKWVPAYEFAICKGGEKIGDVNLRIGYSDSLYYGGQIGYNVDEAYRGNGYAAAACRLLAPVAKAHGMTNLLITNHHKNHASYRVCEKLGARHIELARLPEWHDLHKDGQRFVNVFDFAVN